MRELVQYVGNVRVDHMPMGESNGIIDYPAKSSTFLTQAKLRDSGNESMSPIQRMESD